MSVRPADPFLPMPADLHYCHEGSAVSYRIRSVFMVFYHIFYERNTTAMLALQEFFHQHPKAALGFSGGVDSAYLLYAGLTCGADVRPYFIKTPFQPAFELEDARRLTDQLQVPLTVLEYDILRHPAIAANPADRCYHCKRALFEHLTQQAASDGYRILLDGTNASDQADDRPGMRALAELQVLSPLRECGLTKAEIRRLSREAGLFTWNKPAYACLATRIPAGMPLTAAMLERVEQSEQALAAAGFSDFRIRVFHNAARLQLPESQFDRAAGMRTELLAMLKPYFETILLDMEVRP